MHSLCRLLSYLYYLMLKIYPGQWLAVLGFTWWGWFKYDGTPHVAGVWWGCAALLALLTLAAQYCGFALFLPGDNVPPLHPPGSANTLRGAAAGFFQYGRQGISNPSIALAADVQIRLRGQGYLPRLTVLTPGDLPLKLFNENEADRSSTWYPGSEVRRGSVFIAGRDYSGLRISFVGKTLLVGVESDEDAEALASFLTQD